MKQQTYVLAILIVVSALLLSGCTGAGGTSIKDIITNPGKYDGSTVTVSGKVVETDTSFMRYKINDGEGTIPKSSDF